MPRFPTPVEGYPVIEMVRDLKEDLRSAVERDTEEHQKMVASIDGVKEHVSNLRMESAAMTSSLARIEVSLKTKPETKDDSHDKKLSARLVGIIGSIVTLATAIVTYYATH